MNRTNIEELTLFQTPEESLGYLMWRVSLSWRNSIEDTLKDFGLTHPQFVILATTAWLTRKGKFASQIDISRATGLDPNTTSQILRGLEVKHFIKRTRSLNERNKNPALTELGSKKLNESLPAVEKADVIFFESLSKMEIRSFIKVFQKLKSE